MTTGPVGSASPAGVAVAWGTDLHKEEQILFMAYYSLKASVGARPIPTLEFRARGEREPHIPKLLQDESIFFIYLACKVQSYLRN